MPHAIRRNLDITYIIMDNEVYGLTKGQPSPTTPPGMKAVSKASSMLKMAPQGVMETPLNIMAMVLTYGASFAARGFSGNPVNLVDPSGFGGPLHNISGGLPSNGRVFVV